MNNIIETEYYVEVRGVDDPYSILVHTDCSQLTIEKEDGESINIDIDEYELELIRDAINIVLNNKLKLPLVESGLMK